MAYDIERARRVETEALLVRFQAAVEAGELKVQEILLQSLTRDRFTDLREPSV